MTISHLAEYKEADLSQLEYTYHLLTRLTDDELRAVQQVAIVFINRNHEKDDSTICSLCHCCCGLFADEQ